MSILRTITRWGVDVKLKWKGWLIKTSRPEWQKTSIMATKTFMILHMTQPTAKAWSLLGKKVTLDGALCPKWAATSPITFQYLLFKTFLEFAHKKLPKNIYCPLFPSFFPLVHERRFSGCRATTRNMPIKGQKTTSAMNLLSTEEPTCIIYHSTQYYPQLWWVRISKLERMGRNRLPLRLWDFQHLVILTNECSNLIRDMRSNF